MRKPRVEAILDYARKLGDMKRKKGVLEEWLMYLFLGFFVCLISLLFPMAVFCQFALGALRIDEPLNMIILLKGTDIES